MIGMNVYRALTWIIATILFSCQAFAQPSVAESVCQQWADCWNCSRSTFCHYCAFDHQCHAYGSVYGCAFGMNCNDIHHCVRTTSEFRGCAAPATTPAVLVIVLWTVFCALCVWLTRWVLNNNCNCNCSCCCARNHRDQDTTNSLDDILLAHQEPALTLLERQLAQDEGLMMLEMDQDADSHRCNQCCNWWRKSSKINRKKVLCLSLAALVWLAGTGAAVSTILLFPQAPAYSICNRKIDWSSIFSGLAHGQWSANVDMHFSIYNPNRFALQVNGARARLYHHHTQVASGTLNRALSFDAGSVNDIVGLLRFETTGMQAMRLYKEHLQGELLLDAALDLYTDLRVYERTIYGLNTSFVMSSIDVEVPDTRAYCKCIS